MKQDQNNDNVFLIVNTLSKKYYNARDGYFTSVLYLGTAIKLKKDSDRIIQKNNLLGCESVEVEIDDYMKSLSAKTTEIIIIADTLSRKLDDVRSSIPTIRKADKILTQNIKTTSAKIKAAVGSMFNEFENLKEDATYDVLGIYEEYIIESSTIEMWELKEVTDMLRARRKSPESMRGIVNKILK